MEVDSPALGALVVGHPSWLQAQRTHLQVIMSSVKATRGGEIVDDVIDEIVRRKIVS
jgi:hypothetical protein